MESVAAESIACASCSHASPGEGIPSARMECKQDMEANVGELSNVVRREGSLSFSMFFLAATAIGGVDDSYLYGYVLRVS